MRYSSKIPLWRLANRSIPLNSPPIWMGILNVTPDSFSDGGKFRASIAESSEGEGKTNGEKESEDHFPVDVEAACRQGIALVSDGASILDVGGESTRPGSRPVSPSEQISRTIPVIKRLRKMTDVPISIDTTSAEVADAALSAGAEIVNDISAGTFDPEIVEVVARRKAGVCLGHIRGIPETMQNAPEYRDVVTEVIDFLRSQREVFLNAGVDLERIALDPGLGFGKTTRHHLEILGCLPLLKELGSPILIGHSRKRFLGDFMADSSLNLEDESKEAERQRRDELTAALAVWMGRHGVDIIRVHNVRICYNAFNDPNYLPPIDFEKILSPFIERGN